MLLFAWNAFSWMVLPFHGNSLQTLPEEALLPSHHSALALSEGIYHYPGPDTPNLEKKLARGPRIPFMVYIPGATTLFDPAVFLLNLCFNLATAGILLWVLQRQKDHSFFQVLVTCGAIGSIIALMSDLPLMNWYQLPLGYTLVHVADHLVGMLLCGLLLYRLCFKPQA